MHVEVNFGYLFLFAKNTKFFQDRDDLFALIEDFKFLLFGSDQIVPLKKENFVPVADIVKVVDPETLQLSLYNLLSLFIRVLFFRLWSNCTINIVTVIMLAFG